MFLPILFVCSSYCYGLVLDVCMDCMAAVQHLVLVRIRIDNTGDRPWVCPMASRDANHAPK
jgi:hypothetical protein